MQLGIVTGCKEQKADIAFQRQYLDSLQATLRVMELALNYDTEVLGARAKALAPIADSLAKSPDQSERQKSSEIKAMIGAYEAYMNSHAWNTGALSGLRAEVDALKINSISGLLTRDAFKENYYRLKEEMRQTLREINKTSNPIVELESMYVRLSQQFSALP